MTTHSGSSPLCALFICKHLHHRRYNSGSRRSRRRERRFWRHRRGTRLPRPFPSPSPSPNPELLRLLLYCHREVRYRPRRARSSCHLRPINQGIRSIRSRRPTRMTRGRRRCRRGVTQRHLRRQRFRCHLARGPRSRRRILQRLYCQGT